MSEEYQVTLDWLRPEAARLLKLDTVPMGQSSDFMWRLAFLERLERLVQVLEEIRDKPPPSYTT